MGYKVITADEHNALPKPSRGGGRAVDENVLLVRGLKIGEAIHFHDHDWIPDTTDPLAGKITNDATKQGYRVSTRHIVHTMETAAAWNEDNPDQVEPGDPFGLSVVKMEPKTDA